MLRRQHGAAFVVGNKAERVRPVRLRVDVEHRNIRIGELQRLPAVGTPAGDDDAVDALAEERVDMSPLALNIVGGVAHKHRHPLVGQALL